MNTELGFITQQIKKEVESFTKAFGPSTAGRIISSNDGVIMIEGLTGVKNGELLYISGDKYALALNLEEKLIGAILLTSSSDVSVGDIAYTTGRIVSVPAGKALLGRVINPLGVPLDGKPEIKTKVYRNIEAPAPAIFDRGKVNTPLYTGIKAIDSMIPIGKGQRELIIGDRQTGKTALAVDTILNQKGKNVICVYVAIGEKSSSVSKIIHELESRGAMDYTIIVSSTAGQPAPLQYLAPYTGTAIAEEFMYSGKDVLIVYDDLSKHAVAYRTISLLLRRPSGREAYPGDIFYIHSRLLERSAKLSESLGGGSITALPIIETLAGDISAYIPTNVISITDGQIYLESELFNAGIRPAINVGLSVSRVGGSAQCPAMRKVSSKIRLALAHYRELQVFARFGADLDSSTKATLEMGSRLTESLKQPEFSPVSMEDMVVELYVMQNDYLKGYPAKRVQPIISGFLEYFRSREAALLEKLRNTQDVDNEDIKIIDYRIKRYLERHLR
ncbi:MAG TPA: F0F1 ATP synthase subunit alpha [Clostridia bacterium]|nr:F0F1 ATP synthase subunit alpha [Clostridia bacterium]